MSVPTITERLEAATVKAENASQIMHDVANGGPAVEVPTESGPVPSIQKWYEDLNNRTSGAVGQVQAALDQEVQARQQLGERVDSAVLSYPDYAAASAAAATLPDGQAVEVRSDNNRSELSTRYTVNSEGSIEFAGYAFPSNLAEYDGESLQKIADYGKALPSYTALRAYEGRALAVRVTEKNTSGFFNLDTADTTTIDDGGTCIVDAIGRRWKRSDPGVVRAEYFGMVGDYYLSDGTPNPTPTDNAQAFQRLMDFMDQPSMKARAVLFSAGGFYTSVPLIINFPNRYIYGAGRNATRFIFGNSGVCVQFNNTNPNHGVFSFGGGMTGVGIRGNASSNILLDIDALNHCRFVDIDVAEASPVTGKAYRIGGVVCGHFEDIVYSANATIMSSPAYMGLNIELNYEGTGRPTGNTFVNVIIEGAAGDGCVLTDAENNTFIGGTIENNAGNNINIGATCRTNTWIGTAFESRETSYADVYDAGQMTKLINCYTSRWIRTAGSSFQFSVEGGVHGSFDLQGQYGNVENVQYGFFAPGSFLVHPTTTTKNIYNKTSGGLEFPKVATFTVPFSTNPTTWANNTGRPVQVMVAGSGLVFYVRNGSDIGAGNIGSPITILPGDALRIQASSGTPVISAIPL